MAQTALKTASSLLLLVSIIQGFQDVDHHKTMEVLLGQNASLPCILKSSNLNTIVSIQWNKKDTNRSKLALYAPGHGFQLSPNITLNLINDTNKLVGTHLVLHHIDKGDAGTYICEITGFPMGARKGETELRIKDKIECDMNSTIEVNSGENVTILCSDFKDVEYKWTKDEKAVSDRPSLHLPSVTEAKAGLYKLTVNTGGHRLQAEFTITVRTQTTSTRAGVTTLSAHSGGSETTSISLNNTFATDDTQSTVTTTPLLHNQSDHFENASVSSIYPTSQSYSQSETFNTNGNFIRSDATKATTVFMNDTDVKYPSVFSEITPNNYTNVTELPEDSLSKSIQSTTLPPITTLGKVTTNPNTTLTARLESTTDTSDVTVQEDPAGYGGRSHLGLTLSIIGVMLLIIVALVLYRRRVIKKRMDLPPPFKPPPPPIKYTTVRNSQQHFPTDRCNSIPFEVMELDMVSSLNLEPWTSTGLAESGTAEPTVFSLEGRRTITGSSSR